jgi:GT2 family glycosyltransferase
MKLSVAICTRNRAKSLEATLERFFAQRFAEDYEFELIVVDNDSTDETRQVIERCIEARGDRVKYFFEPRRGVSYTRNKAVSAARGDFIAFTDDDVLVDENWLDEIYREFTKDPSLCLLGGRVLAANDKIQKVALQTSDERKIFEFPDPGTFAIGASMAFRREVFDRIGFFDVRLGAGKFFASAEEADLFYRALKAGYKVLYAPNVLVYHNHDRVSVDQACRLEYGYGKGCSAYLLKHAFQGDAYAMRMVYWMISKLPSRYLRRDGEPNDILLRRRAQIRGIVVGLLTAPLVLLAKDAEQSGRI